MEEKPLNKLLNLSSLDLTLGLLVISLSELLAFALLFLSPRILKRPVLLLLPPPEVTGQCVHVMCMREVRRGKIN